MRNILLHFINQHLKTIQSYEKRVEVRILKNGRLDWPCEYAKVSGRKPNGDWVDAVARTDDRGYATIEWEMGSDYLERICVDVALESNRYIDGDPIPFATTLSAAVPLIDPRAALVAGRGFVASSLRIDTTDAPFICPLRAVLGKVYRLSIPHG